MAKRFLPTLVLAIAVAVTATLVAEPQVTLILRSGDRVTGELMDMGGSGFTLRVRGGNQNIPTGDVAVIDFSGAAIPQAEASRIQDGRAFVVLHSGDTFYGSLYDIGGTNPLRITFRTQDGNRDVNSDQVARIYLARWAGMPSSDTAASRSGTSGAQQGGQGTRGQGGQGTGGQGGQGTRGQGGQGGQGTRGQGSQDALEQGGRGMSVPSNPCWTNTGIFVYRGQYVTFIGSGEIQLSRDREDIAGVAGSKTGRYVSNAPMRRSLAGALIGRVGYGRPFGIGDQQQALPMPDEGELFLGVNDDNCDDNRGEFRVQVNTRRR
jgi:hypothetical protein